MSSKLRRCPFTKPIGVKGGSRSETIDALHREVLDRMGYKRVMQLGWLPTFIAELAWDYADTVLDIAPRSSLRKSRKLSGQIRTLRRSFTLRQQRTVNITAAKHDMLVFEEDLDKVLGQLFRNLSGDLGAQHSSLTGDDKQLAIAAWECHTICLGLYEYVRRITDICSRESGLKLNDVLLKESRKLGDWILRFVEDWPLSPLMRMQLDTYAGIIANTAMSIEIPQRKSDDTKTARQ